MPSRMRDDDPTDSDAGDVAFVTRLPLCNHRLLRRTWAVAGERGVLCRRRDQAQEIFKTISLRKRFRFFEDKMSAQWRREKRVHRWCQRARGGWHRAYASGGR
jgi:hypothetical protein